MKELYTIIITIMMLKWKASWLIIYLYFLDTDECAVNMGGCMQTCTNQVGSYQCGCNDGYDLDVDQHSCVGKKG